MDTSRGFIITLFLLLAPVIVMVLLKKRKYFDVYGRTVIVTGGSQGLGLAIAKLLASKGAHVVIVAQKASKLEKALEELRRVSWNSDRRLMYLSYDLRSPESAPKIIEEVTEWNGGEPPDVVFNCAGHCLPGFFASSSVEMLRDQMETLYWSCTYMAHATLKSWTEPVEKSQQVAKPRHLIFTSSVLAFMPLAGYAAYNPAKAAMRTLADTLNQEVQVYNGARLHPTEPGPAAEIKIHAVYPMGIRSPGYDNEQKTKPALTQKLEEDDKPQEPDELARLIVRELEAGRYMVTCSLIGHIMKGWAMGGSQRVGLTDYIWNWLGSIIVLFIAPDFLSKCFKWGREKGMNGAS